MFAVLGAVTVLMATAASDAQFNLAVAADRAAKEHPFQRLIDLPRKVGAGFQRSGVMSIFLKKGLFFGHFFGNQRLVG